MTNLQISILVILTIVTIGSFIAGCYLTCELKYDMGYKAAAEVKGKKEDIEEYKIKSKIDMILLSILFSVFIICFSFIVNMLFKYIF